MDKKLVIISDGEHTNIKLCGMVIGTGVTAVNFQHTAGSNPQLDISLDLKRFTPGDPDVFDEAMQGLRIPPCITAEV